MNKVLSEQNLYDFLKQICLELPAVTGQTEDENHFFGSYEEAQAAKSNGKLFWPVIIMGSQSGKINPNSVDIKNIKLYILRQVNREDFLQQRIVRDECLEVGMAIVERINQYRHSNNGFGEFFQHFRTWEVSYHEVSSQLDNSIGYMIVFHGGSQRNFKTDL